MAEQQRQERMDIHLEMDALRNDLKDLRADLSNLLKAVKSESKNKADSIGGKIQEETMRRFEQLREVVDNAKDYGQKAYNKAQRKVGEKPLVSVLTAFGVGMILGRLLMRGRR